MGIQSSLSICYQFSSVTQSCPTLCDPMNCNTPGLPVHHQLPEITQIHVNRVGDAMQTYTCTHTHTHTHIYIYIYLEIRDYFTRKM